MLREFCDLLEALSTGSVRGISYLRIWHWSDFATISDVLSRFCAKAWCADLLVPVIPHQSADSTIGGHPIRGRIRTRSISAVLTASIRIVLGAEAQQHVAEFGERHGRLHVASALFELNQASLVHRRQLPFHGDHGRSSKLGWRSGACLLVMATMTRVPNDPPNDYLIVGRLT